MDWMVFFLAIIAIAMAIFTTMFMIAVVRFLSLATSLGTTLARVDQTLDRLNAIGGELELITRRIGRMEERVSGAVNPLLNHALPPIRGITAVLAGLRIGLGALARGKRDSSRARVGQQDART